MTGVVAPIVEGVMAGTLAGTVVVVELVEGVVIVGSPSRGGTARWLASGPKLETTRIATPKTDVAAT